MKFTEIHRHRTITTMATFFILTGLINPGIYIVFLLSNRVKKVRNFLPGSIKWLGISEFKLVRIKNVANDGCQVKPKRTEKHRQCLNNRLSINHAHQQMSTIRHQCYMHCSSLTSRVVRCEIFCLEISSNLSGKQ